MICTCDIDGFKETEDRRLRIFNKMPIYKMELLARSIIISLAFDFQCEANIDADMWFGVSIKSPLLEESLWIECDHPFDAFAFAWEYLLDKFPDKLSWINSKTEDKYAERLSKSMYATYELAEDILNDHYKIHDDNKYNHDCNMCNSLLYMPGYQESHIQDTWGAKDFESEINNAFDYLE